MGNRKTHFKNRGIARRYARALFELSLEGSKVESVLNEIMIFDDLFSNVPRFMKIIQDRNISIKTKHQIIRNISVSLGFSTFVVNLILLLIDRNLTGIFSSIFDEYQDMAEQIEKLAHAKAVISEKGFADMVKKKVEDVLSNLLKKKAVCDVDVDQSIIGGLVVKIGDVVIDNSVKGKLIRMKEYLL